MNLPFIDSITLAASNNLPYSGTHILRHGMATLARKVGGGLDAVIAMTGHKDLKLADHYSKLTDDYQKDVSQKIMSFVADYKKQRTHERSEEETQGNLILLSKYAKKG